MVQVLRGVTTAKEVLYWTLIVGFPCAGWLVLFPSLIYLKFSKCVLGCLVSATFWHTC